MLIKAWPNALNISRQHLATLLHDVATCVERGGQTHATFSSFSTQHVDVYAPQAPGAQQSGPSAHAPSAKMLRERGQTMDYNIMQHPKCCTKNLTLFKFDPTCCNISQHIATWWPNVCNMLCPTMLEDVALKCCEHLARPYRPNH